MACGLKRSQRVNWLAPLLQKWFVNIQTVRDSDEVEQSPPERCFQSFGSSIFAVLRRLPSVPLSFYF